MNNGPGAPRGPLRWLPGVAALRSYDASWLRHDLVHCAIVDDTPVSAYGFTNMHTALLKGNFNDTFNSREATSGLFIIFPAFRIPLPASV